MILFGLDSQLARRFSIILWAGVTIPLIVIGFIAVTAEGYNMSHLHREAATAAKDRQQVA
jgi:hypothetical protein